MTIRSLYIADFSGTGRRTVDLCEGLNIIEGPNESGKSTVAAFIKFMFYGFADKAERTRLYSWGASSASGTLTLIHNRREYRIEREYSEGGREKVSIIDTSTGSPCFEGRSPADVFLGVPADIFTHTAYIGQAAGGSVDGVRVSRAIENILFSADESVNTDKALKKLDDARILLYHKSRKGGRIYDLMGERDALRVRLENAKQSNSGLIAREGSLRETSEGLAEAKEKLAEAQKSLDACDAAKRRHSMAKLAELAEQASSAEQEYSDILSRAEHNGFIPDEGYCARLSVLAKENEQIEGQLAAVKSELEAHDQRMSDLSSIASFSEKLEEMGGDEEVADKLEKIDGKKARSGFFASVGIILTILCGVAAAAAYFLDLTEIHPIFASLPAKPIPSLITGGAAVFMLITAIISIILRAHAHMAENEILADLDVDNRFELMKKLASYNFDETRLRLHNSKSAEFSERITELEKKKKSVRNDAAELLEKWGREDLSSAAAEAAETVAALSRSGAGRDKFILARDTLAAQLGVEDTDSLRAELDISEPIEEQPPEAVERIRREYDFYQKQVEALDARMRRLETELAVLEATVEPPTELADRVSNISAKIDGLSKKHRALVLAHSALTEAASALRESVSPRLSKTAGELMGSLTGGRYTRVGVGHSLELSYEADAQNRGIEYMSAGTRDIAYLSLRFALTELLYREAVPPLIFDESFSRLDDTRYARVIELIGRMCERGSQVLLFTSQHRDSRLAAERLPGCHKLSLR